jgi:hypothetical protein
VTNRLNTIKISGNLSCGLNHAGVGGATILLVQTNYLREFYATPMTDSSGDYHATTHVGPSGISLGCLKSVCGVKLLAKYNGESGNIHGEPATAEITVDYTRPLP